MLLVNLKGIKIDLPAGIVAFLVAVPLCLGVAMASGAPLFSGMIAGIVGGIWVTLISGSQSGVNGLAAVQLIEDFIETAHTKNIKLTIRQIQQEDLKQQPSL